MVWFAIDPRIDEETLGFLPLIFDPEDARKAREQVDDRYAHGGGWQPQAIWVVNFHNGTAKYPGDPEIRALAMSYLPLTDERLLLFPMSYVAIIQRDGSYEMVRMD